MTAKLIPGLLVLLPIVALAAPAQAHNGHGGYAGGPYLEGEDYDTPYSAAGCDPTSDGEHTAPVGSSPSGYAFLPGSGCGINSSVCFASSADIDAIAVRVGGTGVTMTYTIRVLVDSSLHGSATITQSAADGFLAWDVNSPWYSIPAGVHSVSIEYTVDSGPSWANLEVDAAVIAFSGSDTCTGAQETVCAAFALFTAGCLL